MYAYKLGDLFVFVVSEWLPKKNHEKELWMRFKTLLNLTLEKKGCVRAHVTRQIPQPGSLGKSKYKIVLDETAKISSAALKSVLICSSVSRFTSYQ